MFIAGATIYKKNILKGICYTLLPFLELCWLSMPWKKSQNGIIHSRLAWKYID